MTVRFTDCSRRNGLLSLKGAFIRNPSIVLCLDQRPAALQRDADSAAGRIELLPPDLRAGNVVATGAPVNVDAVLDPLAWDLFMKFESLGSDCEFGLAQRKFGAEPLGLFRWASVLPHKFIELFNNNFDGYGDLEHTTLSVAEWGEIIVRDHKYHTARHTFINHRGIDLGDFLAKECKRISFLKRKLLSALEEEEKIFVYKIHRSIDDSMIFRMKSSFRKISNAPLLLVDTAKHPADAGQVIAQRDHFLAGYLDKFGNAPDGWKISFDVWRKICEMALMKRTVLSH